MNCPKCRTVELKKNSSHSPYLCGQCGGMWLLDAENAILSPETIETTDADPGPVDNDQKTGLCPAGHGIMIRARVELDEPFYLERCTDCGGIWFDRGEWIRIAENNLADTLSSIWSRSWQRKQRDEKNRERFLRANRRLLGESLFNATMELTEMLREHPEKDRAIALLLQEVR